MTSYRVGLISDTHGRLRPEALAWLQGSDFIVHAGDIGGPDILDTLSKLAPVTAVRGNNDQDAWALGIPETNVLQVGGISLYIVHALQDLDIDPAAAGFEVVVAGHSHRPASVYKAGVLYVNPGSAGPRRFSLPISAGEIVVAGKNLTPRLVELSTHGPLDLQPSPYR